jgi:hypothetical protein
MQGKSKAFELAGDLWRDEKNPRIFCHKRLKESSPWPHNLLALLDDERKASFIGVKGGGGTDPRKITREMSADLSNIEWVADSTSWKSEVMEEGNRMSMLQEKPSMDKSSIQQANSEFGCVMRVRRSSNSMRSRRTRGRRWAC